MSEKYTVRHCRCPVKCPGMWIAISPSGHKTTWPTWERAMLRATKEY